MRIVEVRDEAGLESLRPAWNALLAESASDTIFLTWEWVRSWWTAYGRPSELRILLAFGTDDVLAGIAPLRCGKVRRYGQTFEVLSFIGDGSADSDYLDFIIRSGHESAVMQAFFDHLSHDLSRGTLMRLNEIPASSPNLLLLQAWADGPGMIWSREDVPCATVPLESDWQQYLSKLPSRFRTKVRSVLRKLETDPDVTFGFCERPHELQSLLPSLYELHRRRWERESKPGVFGWDRKRVFYETLSPLLLERGWLRFSLLGWKSRILACQYGFVYGNRYFQLQEGFNPDCEHWNVGIGLRAWSLRHFISQGLSEYDFLAGTGRHKSDWGARTKISKRIVIGAKQARNVLFCRGPEWVAQARQSVKNHVPQRVLAARDARQEQERAAAFARQQSAQHNGSSQWFRSALAGCYLHSPLPEILPRLRDRFQLQIARNGGVPAISWSARTTPSVRILYFHRINDEGDPFFPSMPLRQFEEQMRYVARHYKVVSLGEAIRRLHDGGASEPAIAITFDDGYQDNFLNAFPVLQRYGLPATIFLTTGSLDSREPLWFEKLALAIKRTSQEAADLELDVPRRIWMRSEAERLKANDEIFSFLRTLPDQERTRRLSEILEALGQTDFGERSGRMLTWDQVRLMSGNGISFGGHTVTHPFVSKLDPEQACWEFTECKRRIEQELQLPVAHFAYPNGREEDFEPWNKQLLRNAGYEAAVSTLWGINGPDTDRMELRRGGPWEETTALFAAKLDWYQWVNG